MARFDVDASPTTYHPSEVEWLQPARHARHDGSSVRSSYWTARLHFATDLRLHLAAAFEEWEAFDDGAQHTIVLPPPNDAAGGDTTYSNVYVAIVEWPSFPSVQVSDFTVEVRPVSFTS